MQALSMAHCIGQPDQALPVYRFLAANTIEERVQQLVDKKQSTESAFNSMQRSVGLLLSRHSMPSGSGSQCWSLQRLLSQYDFRVLQVPS